MFGFIASEVIFSRSFIHKGLLHMITLAEFLMPDALPDSTPYGFVFHPGILQLLGKCLTWYTVEYSVMHI